jgi:hypothetical protein
MTTIIVLIVLTSLLSSVIAYNLGKKAKIDVIENKKRKPNELEFYFKLKFNTKNLNTCILNSKFNKKVTITDSDFLLFTHTELEKAINRAKNNPEDKK